MRDSEGFVRMRTLQCVVLFVFLLIGGRLAYIQLVDSRYNELAKAKWCSIRRAAKSSTATGSIWSRAASAMT